MTFDAISGLSLTGTVAEIDTVGTVSQGVVTYSAKVALDTTNDQVKPGMTASVTITASVDPDVLTVPSTAIKTDTSGSSYVQILGSDGKPQDVTVVTGDSNDTDTVITSGLTSGQEVITQTVTSSTKTATSTTSSSTSLLGGSTTRGGGEPPSGTATRTTNGAAR
jgi:multidrug efflux pump subunit AcrA (membrane-fusion protein)